MLSAHETLDTYYLEARRDLLEIAAFWIATIEQLSGTGPKRGTNPKRVLAGGGEASFSTGSSSSEPG